MTSTAGRAAGAAIGWRGPAGAHAGCRGGRDKGQRAGSARHRGSAAPPASAPHRSPLHRTAPPVSTAPCLLLLLLQLSRSAASGGFPASRLRAGLRSFARGRNAPLFAEVRVRTRGSVCAYAGARTWPSGSRSFSLSRDSACVKRRVESRELTKPKLLG